MQAIELTIVALAALLIGLALGLFGSGGSILTVPVLVYLLNIPEKIAIASALWIVVLISSAGLIPYILRRQIPYQVVWPLAIPSMLGSALGSWLSQWVIGQVQLTLLAVLMALSAFNMWRTTPWHFSACQGFRLISMGLLLGMLTGLIGVGGGFLLVPLLLAVTRLPMTGVIAASLSIVLLQSLIAAATHAWHFYPQQPLDLGLIAILGGGGALGSLCGLFLVHRLPQKIMRRGFSVFIAFLSLLILIEQCQLIYTQNH